MFRYLPEQASEHAPRVDWLHHLVTDISVFFTVAIVGAMVYFAIRYRQRGGVDHETPQIRGSHFLEVIWTVVPTIICIFIAYYGVVIFRDMRRVDPNGLSINVYAQKWKWDFEYENGKRTTGEVVVPVDQSVRFVMTSADVLHSFFIPAMRVKSDVIPGGRHTYISFKPVKTGEYQSFCTEYCGASHSRMLAKLRVVSRAEYDRWVNDKTEKAMAPAEKGKLLYNQKGCNACHSVDGSRVVGPTFQGLWGREEKLADGASVKVDENYLTQSIYDPNSQIVATYPANVMPSFKDQLSSEEVNAIIAFIKTLDGSVAAAPAPAAAEAVVDTAALSPAERGKKIYQGKLCISCHSLDGSKIVGPSFKGLYGRAGKLSDGSSYTADDAYIKNSILNPTSQVVEGYPPAMPPYQGQLSDGDIADVIEFLKTVK